MPSQLNLSGPEWQLAATFFCWISVTFLRFSVSGCDQCLCCGWAHSPQQRRFPESSAKHDRFQNLLASVDVVGGNHVSYHTKDRSIPKT